VNGAAAPACSPRSEAAARLSAPGGARWGAPAIAETHHRPLYQCIQSCG
jgi:hypothetical protein